MKRFLNWIRACRMRRAHDRHLERLRAGRVTFLQADYTQARKRALEQLGDRYLVARPINRVLH